MTTSEGDSAWLYLPQAALACCLFSAVERNTLTRQLTDAQRFNHYPASPLPQISWIFHGDLHMVQTANGEPARLGPVLPQLVIAGAQSAPSASWSPGPVHALSVAFYPDALAGLLGRSIDTLVDRIEPLENWASPDFVQLAQQVLHYGNHPPFAVLQAALMPLWQATRRHSAAPLLGDWIRTLLTRAAFSDTGVGLRQWQRRIKRLTGQSQQELQCFAQIEAVLLQLAASPPGQRPPLADLAMGAQFSDQSHMGRIVRRITGLSPGRLLQMQQHEESFWFYRLLEGHVRASGLEQ